MSNNLKKFFFDPTEIILTKDSNIIVGIHTKVSKLKRSDIHYLVPESTLVEEKKDNYEWEYEFKYDDLLEFSGQTIDYPFTAYWTYSNQTYSQVNTIQITVINYDNPPIINYIKSDTMCVLLNENTTPNLEVIFEAKVTDEDLIPSSNITFVGGNNNSELILNNNNLFRWRKIYNYNDYTIGITSTETYIINFKDINNNNSNTSITIKILRYEYYLSTQVNLNNYILTDGVNVGLDTNSLTNDLSSNDISGFLPENTKTINISDINIEHLSNKIIYDLLLIMNVDSSGNTNAIVDVSGEPYTATIPEDLRKLQILSWPTNDNSQENINVSSPDILSATITPNYVKLYLSNLITSIENNYSGPNIISIDYSINAIPPSSNNLIQLFASNTNFLSESERTYPNIFLTDEVIALEVNNLYKVSIIDKNNIIQTIIPETKIVFFLKQI